MSMENFDLWPFQKQAVVECRKKFKQNKKRILLCSPTGSGKTVMACWFVKKSLAKGKTVSILVDRKEILNQFDEALRKFGLYAELVLAGSKPQASNLYLGMVESFDRRLKTHAHLASSDFIIFDEAHSTSYFKIIQQLPDKFVMGLTATPVLTTSKSRLNEYYDDIVELSKVEDLIKQGFLANAKTYSADLVDVKKLKKQGGEYSEESQFNEFGKTQVIHGVLDSFKTICPHAKFICYNVNVKHSKETCSYFNFMGVKSRHVDGESDPAYRKETFAMLKAGAIQGVHNFGICTTGFDEPSVDCIIQNFATASLSKHIQTAGRGARKFQDKSHFTILDMGMNYARHGLWNVNKDWSSIFHQPQDESKRQEQDKINNVNCHVCGYVMPLDLNCCPICDTKVVEIVKHKQVDKKPLKADLKLIKAQLTSKLPAYLQNRTISSMTKSELIAYANCMDYNMKWVYLQLGLRRR